MGGGVGGGGLNLTWPGPSDPGCVYGSCFNSCRPLLAHLLADTVWVVSWPLDTAARTRPSSPSAAAVPLALGEGGGGLCVSLRRLPYLHTHTTSTACAVIFPAIPVAGLLC